METRHFEQTRRAAAEYNERVLDFPNVIGCGVGRKSVGGHKTDQPCLVVYVERKLPIEALRAGDVLPRMVETRHGDLAIDVVERSMPVAFADSAEYRPLRGGCELGTAVTGGGTLGAVMYDRRDASVVLLTCNHCLTPTLEPSVVPGDTRVFQPSGGKLVGRTKRIVPWLPPPLGAMGRWRARVDAGIVALDAAVDARFRVISLGKHPYVPLPPSEGLPVRKRGARSELTEGTVSEVDIIFAQKRGGAIGFIGGQGAAFSVQSDGDTPFARPGDSGSLIVDSDGAAARGILTAGDEKPDGFVYCCTLNAIMEELELETPCTGAMNAVFTAALHRRLLLASLTAGATVALSDASPKHITKFRARYMTESAAGTLGGALEDTFQALGPDLADALLMDDEFAGLLDDAIGDIVVQPTVFDMLRHRPSADFGERLMRAFTRLKERNPDCCGFEWIAEAFDHGGDVDLRELLARPAPPRRDGERIEPTRHKDGSQARAGMH